MYWRIFWLFTLFYFSVAYGEDSNKLKKLPPIQLWTCSMHPDIRKNVPGNCPVCDMALIPLGTESFQKSGAALVKLTPYAEKLAELRTMPVRRAFVSETLRFSGRVEYDETRLANISARFPGRVEQLYVNYNGIPVKQGEHIAELFSPELMVLQREYLLAVKAASAADGESLLPSGIGASVRAKMRLWGLTEAQIAELDKRGSVSERMTLLAPISGIVIQKNIVRGQYFKEGDPLFTISDLSHLWLIFDSYESDIRFLRYGQELSFQVEAFPGEIFRGRIAYISPEMNRNTRSVPVRVNVANEDGHLRPGMLARVSVSVTLDAAGTVWDDSLAGKWISPMHPEIIKDSSGICDICGMALVPAESLGYAKKTRNSALPPLIIPASAPLITGRRAIVYVRTAPGEYAGRLVVLGARAGDFYTVISGLSEGDELVYNGNMKIDSAAQIAGLPSMTSPANFDSFETAVGRDSLNSLEKIFPVYFKLWRALASSDTPASSVAVSELNIILDGIPDRTLRKRLSGIFSDSSRIGDIREAFSSFSAILYTVYTEVPSASENIKAYRVYCPMAFNGNGAYWIQDSGISVLNPYFGQQMLHCGEFK